MGSYARTERSKTDPNTRTTSRQKAAMPLTISDLRQRPEFFDHVADRIWRAWWQADGPPLDHIFRRVRETMNAAPIPLALVAHDGEAFLATASVIASDLAERPELTPWVAAVWVEEKARGHGIGAALVERAVQDCFALAFDRAYLCARPRMLGFYERLGWTLLERQVGRQGLDVFFREANTMPRTCQNRRE